MKYTLPSGFGRLVHVVGRVAGFDNGWELHGTAMDPYAAPARMDGFDPPRWSCGQFPFHLLVAWARALAAATPDPATTAVPAAGWLDTEQAASRCGFKRGRFDTLFKAGPDGAMSDLRKDLLEQGLMRLVGSTNSEKKGGKTRKPREMREFNAERIHEVAEMLTDAWNARSGVVPAPHGGKPRGHATPEVSTGDAIKNLHCEFRDRKGAAKKKKGPPAK